MRHIIAGTRNPAKLAALGGLLRGVATVSAPPGRDSPDSSEKGRTVAEIAETKARIWSDWLLDRGVTDPVVVTDGGLLVPSLGSAWDPTRTRRFTGKDASPIELAEALLDRCLHLVGDDRRIGWIEAASVAIPRREPVTFIAESPLGVLATSLPDSRDRSHDEFWIPSIWLCPDFGLKRLSDLTSAERDARPDHWCRIGADLRRYLRGVAGDP